jgi:RNA polymerase sigma factor (sigma-70 family)
VGWSCVSWGVDVHREDVVTEIGDPLIRKAVMAQRADRYASAMDLDALYRTHQLRFVRLATAITLDRSVAEEVVQDAFASLHRQSGVVDNPVAYLQRSVVNNSISVIRRRRTAARFPLPTPAVTLNPEIDETWAAVSSLPARERAVVVLRYWLDLPEADIASCLGWPAGTVKSTLHRALKRLKKELPQ